MEDFPLSALLPKDSTGALRFLKEHPEYDGRGIKIAVFDTGVDPGASYLQTTTEGLPKIVDIVDTTGSGDIDTSTVRPVEQGQVLGLSGRKLTIPPTWDVTEVRLGLVFAFTLFPEDLRRRVKEKRRQVWDEVHRERLASLRVEQGVAEAAKNTVLATELTSRIAALVEAEKSYSDPGPMYDVIVYRAQSAPAAPSAAAAAATAASSKESDESERKSTGTWRVVVDTSEAGNLAASRSLADYAESHEYATFSELDSMNYSVKIYDDAAVVSIVCTAGSHGTHVASIIAAHNPANPEHNGLAPGAQLVSVKIGDTRLGSMETGAALVRGLIVALQHKCDLINLSYGEATTTANVGRFIELVNEAVNKHGIVFVASAGNNGPALSSVGCPGGTTASIISVAALVTGPMMDAAYSLVDIPPDMAYTWSSRGPSPDGALGVTICAPGGAITSVPNWTLKKAQLMNGTSMSSPNACGSIALVLSALKARGVKYSPASVRRALENTATPPPQSTPFDVGYGLLQVDASFAHSVAHAAVPWQHARFTLQTRCHGVTGRGIYLREAGRDALSSPIDGSVTITPHLPDTAPAAEKVNFELNLRLVSTQPWVRCPPNFALLNEARAFTVQIDASRLSEGVHYAEIVAMDTANAAAGAVVRVPVTVVVPALPTDQNIFRRETLAFTPGKLYRFFVAVPAGAQWVEARLSSHDYTGSRRFGLHLQQLAPHTPYRDLSQNDFLTLEPHSEWRGGMEVRPGAVLEACFTQWWSSLGSSSVTLTLEFRGFLTGPVHIRPGFSSARMDVFSHLKTATLVPTAVLDKYTRTVKPTSAAIKPLSKQRDVFVSERQIYGLTLTYTFSQKDKGLVRPIVPHLSDVLYESAYESQLWQLYDSRRRRVAVGDAYPSHYGVTLAKGEYTLHLQIRHENIAMLEKLTSAPLVLERPLKDNITLDVFDRMPATGGTKIRDLTVAKGCSTCLYVVMNAAEPSYLQSGDVLSGHVALVETLPKDSKYSWVDLFYYVGAGAAAGPASSNGDAPETLEAALRDTEIAWLAKHSADAYPEIYHTLVTRHPTHLPVRTANLKLVVEAHTKKPQGAALLAAAEEVLALIDTRALAEWNGRRTVDADKATKVAMETAKKALVFALVQKGHALLSLVSTPSVDQLPPSLQAPASDKAVTQSSSMVLISSPTLPPWRPDTPKTPAQTPVLAVAAPSLVHQHVFAHLIDTLNALAAWVDIATETDYLELYTLYELQSGRGGAALQAILKALSDPSKTLIELRNKVLAHYGWQHLLWDEEIPSLFPATHALF